MNFDILINALTQIVVDIINFIPNLINGLIILIVGYLLAQFVRRLLSSVLGRIGFDPLVERTGITGALRGLGVRIPLSHIMADTIFWLLLISFLITSTRLMGLEAVAQLLEQLLIFLPSIIAAVIVFLLGGIVARFTGDLVASLASGVNITYATRLGRVIQYMLSLFVAILALNVLGIDTGILVTAITIMIAAFGLAVGLALGLGARGVVVHILAGYYLRQRFPVGQMIAVDAVVGIVRAIGGVNTVVATRDGIVVIPNSHLLESLVRSPLAPNSPQSRESSGSV